MFVLCLPSGVVCREKGSLFALNSIAGARSVVALAFFRLISDDSHPQTLNVGSVTGADCPLQSPLISPIGHKTGESQFGRKMQMSKKMQVAVTFERGVREGYLQSVSFFDFAFARKNENA